MDRLCFHWTMNLWNAMNICMLFETICRFRWMIENYKAAFKPCFRKPCVKY